VLIEHINANDKICAKKKRVEDSLVFLVALSTKTSCEEASRSHHRKLQLPCQSPLGLPHLRQNHGFARNGMETCDAISTFQEKIRRTGLTGRTIDIEKAT